MTVMHNSASTLINEFYTFRYLIVQYTDFELLENDAKIIGNRVDSFVINCSNEINDAVNLVYFGLNNTWSNIRSEINPIICNELDNIFVIKFGNIKEVEYSGT